MDPSSGFSIREYTALTRAADIAKCWPFGPCVDRHQAESFLPPITVAKFRWWLDALSGDQIDSAPAVPFGSLILSSPHDDDDHCRNKSRKKKERSMVEIFAVSPRVNKEATVTREKKQKDESNVKLEQKIPSDTGARLSFLESCEQKCASKPVFSQKKRKPGESWEPWLDFDAKRQKQGVPRPENPIRGVLKRCSEFSSGQGSEIGFVQFQSTVISRDAGDKHVKFGISVCDDNRRFDEGGMGQLAVCSDDNNAAEAIIQSVVVGDDDSDSKRNRSGGETAIDAEDSPHCSVEENHGEHVGPSADQWEKSVSSKGSHVCSQLSAVLDKPVAALDKRTSAAIRGSPYADYSKQFYEVARPISACANDLKDRSIIRYDRHPVVPCHIYSPGSTEMMRAVSVPSSFLCSSNLAGASSRPSPHHPLRLMHPPEPSGSSYVFLADGLTSEDMSGLPLNLNGQLSRVNPGSGSMLYHAGTSDNFRLRMTISGGMSDQLDSFRILDLDEKDPFSLYAGRSHPRTEVDWYATCRPEEEGDLRFRGQRVAYMGMCEDHASLCLAPPTMRLMGRDVPVTHHSRSTNGSEDGSIWTDKAVMMEHCSPMIDKASLLGKNRFSQQWIMQTDFAITKEAECRRCNPCVAWHNNESSAKGHFNGGMPILRHPNPLSSSNFCSPGLKCHHQGRGPVGFGNVQNTCPWIRGPLLYPEIKEYSQQSQGPPFHSSNIIPPWITAAPAPDLNKAPSYYYQAYLDTRYNSPPISANYAFGSENYLIQAKSSSGQSSPRPPFMPILPRIRTCPAKKPRFDSHSNMNSRNVAGWNPSEILGSAPFRNSCQEPASLLVDPEKHSRSSRLQQPLFAGVSYTGATPGSVDIDFCRGTGSLEKYMGPRIVNLGPRTSHVMSSVAEHVNTVEVANPGPAKLTAGAKHVLKPSSDTSKARPVLVHSTVPFGGVTQFSMVPDCQPRSTKIFKL